MLLKEFKREFIDKELSNKSKGFTILLANQFNEKIKIIGS